MKFQCTAHFKHGDTYDLRGWVHILERAHGPGSEGQDTILVTEGLDRLSAGEREMVAAYLDEAAHTIKTGEGVAQAPGDHQVKILGRCVWSAKKHCWMIHHPPAPSTMLNEMSQDDRDEAARQMNALAGKVRGHGKAKPKSTPKAKPEPKPKPKAKSKKDADSDGSQG